MNIKKFNKQFNRKFNSWEEAKGNITSIEWAWVSGDKTLNYDFIHKYRDFLNWPSICCRIKLTENFIIEHKNYIDWCCVCQFQKLSESFIHEHTPHFANVWFYISQFQKLSEEFIREHMAYVKWKPISQYQKLSESFIREFKNCVDWEIISKYQKLSEEFIHEFKDYVDWYHIAKYQKVSIGFINLHVCGLGMAMATDFNSWIDKDIEFKKRQIMASGYYECHEDYFIAYKGIRSDRYSRFNFQYQYLPDHTYESWCDCSDDVNSFGLSVWHEDGARDYCNELVVKVKVRYEDVGRMIDEGETGKIRCFKITILT